MINPVSLLALALALGGLIVLVALIWHRRWLELAIVLLVGCTMALYFERGRRGPDRIGKLVAEVVNADRSISLHVQVKPGTAVWCSSVFSVEAPPRRRTGEGIGGLVRRPASDGAFRREAAERRCRRQGGRHAARPPGRVRAEPRGAHPVQRERQRDDPIAPARGVRGG